MYKDDCPQLMVYLSEGDGPEDSNNPYDIYIYIYI